MIKKPQKGKSLAEVSPDLAKEWHPTKNGDLTPYDVTPGESKKAWWRCDKGEDHVWDCEIRLRTGRDKYGCSICSGRKVVKSNCFSTTHPEIAKEWHPTKNGDLLPSKITKGLSKKIWWKCDKGEDHEWIASLNNRSRGRGCPICSNNKVVKSNCLSTTHPEITKFWHPTKNVKLKPTDVTSGSTQKVWWKCNVANDHEWEKSVVQQVKVDNCPCCSGKKLVESNSLKVLKPELAILWHPIKNVSLKPTDITVIYSKRIWWKCDKGEDHEWHVSLSNLTKSKGCPFCSNKRVSISNSLVKTHPDIAARWHPTKNENLLPSDFMAGSEKKIWWKCSKGDDHEWQAVINSQRVSGCPICTNKKIVKSNCLSTTHPEITKEWHPIKNGKHNPLNIGAGSNKKIWWKCDKGEDHEWIVSPSSRIFFNSGCPFCSGRKVSITNCLAKLRTDLAKQWHPTKNGNLTPNDVTEGSNNKVWWKCNVADDHEWENTPNGRTSNNGSCPICSGHITVLSNSIFTLDPKKASFFHKTKNGSLTTSNYAPNSGKKVWWKCPKGDDHIWKTSSGSFSGCPYCHGFKVSLDNNLLAVSPVLAKEWHPTKNGRLSPDTVYAGGAKTRWWKCNKGKDHEWRATISSRIQRGTGCPYCVGQKVSLDNNLLAISPVLAKEWHPTKNGGLSPDKVYAGGAKNHWWKCNKGEDHVWRASLDNRLRMGTGCPFCTLTPQSKQELTITFELKTIFKNIDPKGFKTRVNGKLMTIDIYIPELNLGIEFDGSYWHKTKHELDKLKTEKLEKDGFTILRVREEPLKPITDIDVLSRLPFNAKIVTDDILEQIIKKYQIDGRKRTKVKNYLLKETLQNIKKLDSYIEEILIKKAENELSKRATTIT